MRKIRILLLIILSTLFACSTPKEIIKEVYTADTLYSFKVDTVKVAEVSHMRDTVIQKEYYYYTITEAGDTTKTIIYRDIYHGQVKFDSTALYNRILDSLVAYRNQSREVIRQDSESARGAIFGKNNFWLYLLLPLVILLVVYIIYLRLKK